MTKHTREPPLSIDTKIGYTLRICLYHPFTSLFWLPKPPRKLQASAPRLA